jgi:hypothetical protein
MPAKSQPTKRREPEPVGIVISGGRVPDTAPVIWAYVWGPAPEKPRKSREPRAA